MNKSDYEGEICHSAPDTKQGEEIRTLSGNENASNFTEAEK